MCCSKLVYLLLVFALVHLIAADNLVTLIGRVCSHKIDCNTENAHCNLTTKQCFCDKGYVPADNRQKCLKIIDALTSECTDERQCLAFLANTTCADRVCKCIDGYHLVNNKCWKSLGFGQPCSHHEECEIVDGGECVKSDNNNRLCGCKADTIINMNSKHCLSKAKNYLDDCMEDRQCYEMYDNTTCIDKQCRCNDDSLHFEVDLGRCILSRGLEEICTTDYDCYQKEDTNGQRGLQCRGNVCWCSENYNLNGDICILAVESSGSNKRPLMILLTFITISAILL
ncbi:prion-like-(Q/N-rich) domain-bearing protein 25 isoform X2 [Prorops nasuta]|uniref:prion-like-(Q/N-rich) domain-bearing protein 25 isoform X2 n=1 Tax=Prorops nasuta TaxID=863751 RepID=UPI0034CD87B4